MPVASWAAWLPPSPLLGAAHSGMVSCAAHLLALMSNLLPAERGRVRGDRAGVAARAGEHEARQLGLLRQHSRRHGCVVALWRRQGASIEVRRCTAGARHARQRRSFAHPWCSALPGHAGWGCSTCKGGGGGGRHARHESNACSHHMHSGRHMPHAHTHDAPAAASHVLVVARGHVEVASLGAKPGPRLGGHWRRGGCGRRRRTPSPARGHRHRRRARRLGRRRGGRWWNRGRRWQRWAGRRRPRRRWARRRRARRRRARRWRPWRPRSGRRRPWRRLAWRRWPPQRHLGLWARGRLAGGRLRSCQRAQEAMVAGQQLRLPCAGGVAAQRCAALCRRRKGRASGAAPCLGWRHALPLAGIVPTAGQGGWQHRFARAVQQMRAQVRIVGEQKRCLCMASQ